MTSWSELTFGAVTHFVELNDSARAADDFTALIRLNSRIAGYFDNRLHAYRSLGRLSEALNDANTEVRMRPDQAFVCRSRAWFMAI